MLEAGKEGVINETINYACLSIFVSTLRRINSRTRGEWPYVDVECRLTCIVSIFVYMHYQIRREPRSAVVRILYQMLLELVIFYWLD